MVELSKITMNVFSLFVILAFSSELTTSQSPVKMADTINTFGIQVYKELSKSQPNLICSGYSISTVLNMLLAGARGNTADEIRNVLNYNAAGLDQSEAEKSYYNLLTQQRKKQSDYQLDVANSVWIQKNFDVLPEFKEKMTNIFYAEEQEIDFTNADAKDKINAWVNEATNNKIPTLFDEPLDASTALVLTNAMYFKGNWITKFDESRTQPFTFTYGKNNKEATVQMMNVYSEFSYTESTDLDAQVLELPYDGNEVSMVFVLPKSGNDLNQLHKRLDHQKLKFAIDTLTKQNVHVKLPKFESSSTIELNDVLRSLGINEAFSTAADLSGIDGHRDLYVSKAVQKATIEVSEEGTVAAAASGMNVQFKSMPINQPKEIYFTADHPFLYFIRHQPTGLLLFMGSKTQP